MRRASTAPRSRGHRTGARHREHSTVVDAGAAATSSHAAASRPRCAAGGRAEDARRARRQRRRRATPSTEGGRPQRRHTGILLARGVSMTTAIDPKKLAEEARRSELVQQLSRMSEAHALNVFWAFVSQPNIGTPERLSALFMCSVVTIQRPPEWDRAAIRRAHEQQSSQTSTIQPDHRRCFACEASHTGPLYRHHIVEIQNGGSNSARNQVPLCFDCHQFIHPWLRNTPAPPRQRPNGFESLGEIYQHAGNTPPPEAVRQPSVTGSTAGERGPDPHGGSPSREAER